MKKPRPIRAWAIVKVKNPKIDALEIYKDKNVLMLKTEKLIRVEIRPIK